MGRQPHLRPRSPSRSAVAYAAASLIPVLVLGVTLGLTNRGTARERGLAEARRHARLVAGTALEPALGGASLQRIVRGSTRARLMDMTRQLARDGEVLRVRIRNLDGRVVFSNDGSGFRAGANGETQEAARGEVVAHLTRLNEDANDPGEPGVEAVEVYQPLRSAAGTTIGVLELYLPYAGIKHDVTVGLRRLYRDLALGLGALYLVLFTISLSVSRGMRREAKRNAFLAEHDTLTGLPNRARFSQRAAAAVAVASDAAPVTIAIVDLDRFKEINDTLGHRYGDDLLCAIAGRLDEQVPTGDTVARLGGDEFGLVLCDVADPEAALSELRDTIEREVQIGGLPVSVGASVGFVRAPADGDNVDDLLQRAEVAMYVAKAMHEGVVGYDPSQDQHDPANLALIGELRHAFGRGELVLHFQPKIALAGDRTEALEALVRWRHPVHGLLAPDRFIPLAEQTDLIEKLTDWVLDAALGALGDFDRVVPDVRIAVNVSARSLSRTDLARRVHDALARHRVRADRLIVEITETALAADPVRAVRALRELDELGVRVSIDDFGKGQTSLGHLPGLPVHELKIDKSFVIGMLSDSSHAAIVRSVIDLGHNLSLRVVAEGVETEGALDELRGAGCDVAQGFLFAKPMPADELLRWLAGERRYAVRVPIPPPAPSST